MNTQRHAALVLSLLVASFLPVGCGSGIDEPPPPGDPAFGRGTQTIFADVDHVTTARPVRITTRCVPLVSGKGHIVMSVRQMRGRGRIHVLHPIDTALIQASSGFNSNDISYPLDYHANVPLELHWRVQLPDEDGGYGFSGFFVIDSLKMDDGRMIWIDSKEANAHAPQRYGFERFAPTEPDGFGIWP